MKTYVGVTDRDWFDLLSHQPQLDEVNFWQPSGHHQFGVLAPGELFVFKLHSPNNYIVGGGIFAHSSLLPISIAWETFGLANGVPNFYEMRKRVAKYRPQAEQRFEDYTIGCILLEQPFFLPREMWIPVPSDWKSNIVQGRSYDLTITPSYKIEISRRIKEEFENGKEYYRHHGNTIRIPPGILEHPAKEFLEWHNANIFKG